jgi:ABC-type sugar transport system ATPase subunit
VGVIPNPPGAAKGPGHAGGDPAPRLSRRGDPSTPLVRVVGVRKSFGATQALRDCNLELRPGEVHALLGENGSGKSTLVKILSGVHRPHGGHIELNGQRIKPFTSPRDARAANVATVFQEILVAPQQSVLTNVWLGTDGVLRRNRTDARRRQDGAEVLGTLLEIDDLTRPISHLTLSDRQAVCIARALVRGPQVLILDEATSALDVATRDRLFAAVERLRAGGAAILFISHRMDEVLAIADRVTVMRGGVTVATLQRDQASTPELVRLMTGLEDADAAITPATSAKERVRDRILLRTNQVQLRADGAPINFRLKAGELVGLAGLEGHGQDEFLRVLAGSRPLAGCVERIDEGEASIVRSLNQAIENGIALLPRDRRDESIFETRSTLDNFQLTTVKTDRRRGLVRKGAARKRFAPFIADLQIAAGHTGDAITSLSGGNQQKVVLSRWLATEPEVLLLNDPTRGVDIGAKLDIYRVLGNAASRGMGVVVVSTELVELIDLMDRVLVFREGHLFREFTREELTRERLVASYFGQEHA